MQTAEITPSRPGEGSVATIAWRRHPGETGQQDELEWPTGNGRGRAQEGDRELSPEMLATLLVDAIIPSSPEGFTVDPRTGEPPRCGRDEFIVSMAGFELVLEPPVLRSEVLTWLRSNLSAIKGRGRFVGGSRNPGTGLFHVGISVVVRSFSSAVRVAEQNGQLSVYYPELDILISCPEDLEVARTRASA